MSVSSVPDILAFSRLSRAVGDLKSQADTARTEMVTGQFNDVTTAANGDIGGVHLLKKAVEDAQAYQQNLALAENRTARTQAVLGSLSSESTRIGASALSALGADLQSQMKTVAQDARGTLFTIFSALNTTAGGRALFSGDATDTPPLGAVEDLLSDVQAIIASAADAAAAGAALDVYFNDPAGGFATSIYQGGAGEAPAVELAPGIRLQSAVKADAQPIKDMIRSFAVLANYQTLPSGSLSERNALATSAAGLALKAETELVGMRAAVGVSEGRIAERKAQYQAEESVLTQLLNARTARDPFEAAAQLQLLESQLEASFIVTARLGNLSLANFLR